MNTLRSFLLHTGLLIASTSAAALVWSMDEKPKTGVQAEITVWSDKASDLKTIIYEGKNKVVRLEPKSDEVGQYFLGTLEKTAAASDGEGEPAKTIHFVSVDTGKKLLESLCQPLL